MKENLVKSKKINIKYKNKKKKGEKERNQNISSRNRVEKMIHILWVLSYNFFFFSTEKQNSSSK